MEGVRGREGFVELRRGQLAGLVVHLAVEEDQRDLEGLRSAKGLVEQVRDRRRVDALHDLLVVCFAEQVGDVTWLARQKLIEAGDVDGEEAAVVREHGDAGAPGDDRVAHGRTSSSTS